MGRAWFLCFSGNYKASSGGHSLLHFPGSCLSLSTPSKPCARI